MKRLLLFCLTFMLLLTLPVPVLAEDLEGVVIDSDATMAELSPDSVNLQDSSPLEGEHHAEPTPPDLAASSTLESVPAPAPEPVQDPGSIPQETPAVDVPEDQMPVVFFPLDFSSLFSGSDDLDDLDTSAPDITESVAGPEYVRTVDITSSAFLNMEDLTMRSALVAVFGEYQQKIQTVSTYYDGQLLETSTEYVPGIAGMDMEWIAGVLIFTVFLFCFMKFLGGMFK